MLRDQRRALNCGKILRALEMPTYSAMETLEWLKIRAARRWEPTTSAIRNTAARMAKPSLFTFNPIT
eukprot:8236849-Lingulodinium_polyedra.AAC.1